jgi:altronate dehydratase large subunit
VSDAFLGYRRPDGSAGTRNHVLVIPGGIFAQQICRTVRGTHTIVTSDQGTGRSGRDRETIARTLIGLGRNPNVAAVILHEGVGGGYPELAAERVAGEIARSGKPVELIGGGERGGDWAAVERGTRLARQLVHEASRLRREPCPVSELTLGVKCGGSDPTSGVAGNPAIGAMFDRVVGAGGTAIFGETTEVIGAEHILMRRAATPEVAQALAAAVEETERRALSTGEDIRTINPVPANIRSGISTLEEKSLGAIHKAGSEPLRGVLKYGQRPPTKGLYFADTYAWNQSIFGSHAASGATLMLYQFGGSGAAANRTLVPSNVPVVPLMWTTASPISWERCQEDVDFYAGTVIAGEETIDQAGERLYRLVLDIASGSLTRTETIAYQDSLQMYLLDPML